MRGIFVGPTFVKKNKKKHKANLLSCLTNSNTSIECSKNIEVFSFYYCVSYKIQQKNADILKSVLVCYFSFNTVVYLFYFYFLRLQLQAKI